MRADLRTTSSRTVIVPLTAPARRAVSAAIEPSMRLDSPCTRAAQTMSPTTDPSTWRSAEASTSPLIVTSAPMTEKVEPPLATGRAGRRGERPGMVGSGVCEKTGGGHQEGARIDGSAVDPDFEMQVRAGRAAGVADQPDHVACSDLLADTGAPGRHVGVTGHHAVAMADFDDFSVTGLGAHEGNRALGGGVHRIADAAAEVEAGMHRRATVERVRAVAEARRDHLHVHGHDLRDAVEPALERVHPREAQAEALEARVERTVTFGRESLERTAHSDAGSGDHGPWVEPKFAQRRFRARGALVGETGETLDEGELARFDARESGGFRDRSADLLDGFC